MLPKNLASSYSQYKNDTDTIASWLATTSKIFGFVPQTSSSGGRKKGKARKAEKISGSKSYTVAIKDFTKLAEFLAARDAPPIKVPPRFAALLDRAIATRQWYSGAISPHLPEDAKKLDSDDRHAFFLGILRNVRDILAPRFPVNYAATKKVPKTVQEVQNMFENLELEVPSEAFENAPDIVPNVPDIDAVDTNYKAEPIENIKEDFLAFHLLLSDLNKLRTEVSWSWEGYKQGLVDITAASITTNVAVDLARAMEEDLRGQFSRHGGSEQMLPRFYAAQCAQAGSKESAKELPNDAMNFRMYELSDVVFWPAFLMLDGFCDVLQPGQVPIVKPGFFGKYDPSSDRSKKSVREKFNEDQVILLEILPEFALFCMTTPRAPAEDEFTRGLRMMFKTKKVTLSMAFATTLFLDIHHILRSNVGNCFSELVNIARFAMNNINTNFKFHENLRIDTWPKQNDEFVKAFYAEIQHWLVEDPHRKIAIKHNRTHLPKPWVLLHDHPWSCGLWKYYIQTQFRDLSVNFANAWGSIMFCAHLYNALQSEKLLTKAWLDMDICSTLQGTETFFAGGAPRNPEDYLKRLVLAFGGSLTNFSKSNRKKKNLALSKSGPRSLKYLSPVMNTFSERFGGKNPRYDLRTEDIETILEKSDWQHEMDESNMPSTLIRDSDKIPGMQKGVPKKLPVSKLLGFLRATLHAEMMELSFDYLTLHRFCWRLLRQIKDYCRDRLISMYGPDYIEKESQLPFIVGYILGAATNTDRVADFLKIKQTTEVTSAVLAQAADALNEMLVAGAGELVCKILRENLGIPIELQDDDDDNDDE